MPAEGVDSSPDVELAVALGDAVPDFGSALGTTLPVGRGGGRRRKGLSVGWPNPWP